MDSKLTIAQWAEEDKPREKLEALGAGALSKAELLAILIGSGTPDEDAVSLMKRILADVGDNLYELGKLSIADLQRYKGIGPAKAITIKAACELGKRRSEEKARERKKIDSAQAAVDLLKENLRDLPHEECHAILLDISLKLIDTVLIAKGTTDSSLVDIRIVLREAILRKTSRIILVHNHPSGNLTPSRQDDQLTQRLKLAAEHIQIPLVDHIIISSEGYYSYSEEGKF